MHIFAVNCGLLLLGGRGCGAVLSAVERVFFAGDGAGFLMMRMGDFCDDLGGIAGSRSTNVRATKKVRPHCPTQFELGRVSERTLALCCLFIRNEMLVEMSPRRVHRVR